MKNVKKLLSVTIILAVILGMMNLSFATMVQPRYTYIMNGASAIALDRDRGLVTCTASSTCRYHMFSLEGKMTLYCDGDAIKTWTGTDNGLIEFDEIRYVDRGHSYYIILNVKVKNAAGTLLEEVNFQSNTVTY